MLALDWAKAFDPIRPDALLTALRRFGVPEPFSHMVQNIYKNRTLLVQDAGARSHLHPQHAGVCQGCPLSPFLFVIIMTVLIHDARAKLSVRSGKQPHNKCLGEILHADDTLLVDTHGGVAEEYMRCVSDVGLEHGLALNPGETEVLRCRCNDRVRTRDGADVRQRESMAILAQVLLCCSRTFRLQDGCGAAVCLGRSVRNVRILGRRWPWHACVLLAAVMAAASGAPALPGGSLCHRSRWGQRGGGGTGAVRETPPAVRDRPNAWDIWLWGAPWRGASRREGDPPSSEACGTLCWTGLPRELCPARVGNRPRRSGTRRLRGHAPVRWPRWPPCSRRRRSWARLSA